MISAYLLVPQGFYLQKKRKNCQRNFVFSEFFCTSDSHCEIYSHDKQNDEINGYCNKTTGECKCEHGLRFNGSQCVGK